ncbi:hypothetical protein [Arenibaculum pallidiluteum]|uniref:hypothetical protein n=1 Tax=Arenibaculum pallidiluteum TaxID=2812559 RepID=UPI001A979005|nr:hypothetical protein [Arenibaculum pallidiluteum]
MFFMLAGTVVCIVLFQAAASLGLHDALMMALPPIVLATALPLALRFGQMTRRVPVRARRVNRPRADPRA